MNDVNTTPTDDGPTKTEIAQGCQCASMLKQHPCLAIAMLGLGLVAILISQIGGILGIIAFYRTM